MQQHEPSKYLLDAWYACKAIRDFTEGITFQTYCSDLKLRSAVERQFEILGEAFSHLDEIAPHYREESPEVGNIIGMRNRIIHGYDTVDDTIIWDAVQHHVPELMRWLEGLSL